MFSRDSGFCNLHVYQNTMDQVISKMNEAMFEQQRTIERLKRELEQERQLRKILESELLRMATSAGNSQASGVASSTYPRSPVDEDLIRDNEQYAGKKRATNRSQSTPKKPKEKFLGFQSGFLLGEQKPSSSVNQSGAGGGVRLPGLNKTGSSHEVESALHSSVEEERSSPISLPDLRDSSGTFRINSEMNDGADPEGLRKSSSASLPQLDNPQSRPRGAGSGYSYLPAQSAYLKEGGEACLLCMDSISSGDMGSVMNLCGRSTNRCLCLVHRSCYLEPSVPMSDVLRQCMICHGKADPACIKAKLEALREAKR